MRNRAGTRTWLKVLATVSHCGSPSASQPLKQKRSNMIAYCVVFAPIESCDSLSSYAVSPSSCAVQGAPTLQMDRKQNMPQVAVTIALHLLLIATLPRTSHSQLSEGVAAFNPFAGQGAPPLGVSAADFPVNVSLSVRRILQINEVQKLFGVLVAMTLVWQDDRTQALTQRSYEDCSFFCSSQSSELLNAFGQPSCCDGVYVPSADARNAMSFPSQSVPYQYALEPAPGGIVSYTTSFSGIYGYHFDYGSYPWDRHYLAIDVGTAFLPRIGQGASFFYADGDVIASQRSGPEFQPGTQRERTAILSVPGWQIGSTWMEIMNQSQTIAVQTIKEDWRVMKQISSGSGYIVYIEINRVSRAFYAAVVILPTALIVIFSFILFSLGRKQFKARINILLLLFLSLIILQYVLSDILPGTYTLLTPIYLILVSYIYNFLLLFTSILSYSIYMQHTRQQKKRSRQHNKHNFSQWMTALRKSLLPSRKVAPDLEAADEFPEDDAEIVQAKGLPSHGGKLSNLILRKPGQQAASAQTSGKKHSEQAIEEIDEQTRDWFGNLQKCWYAKRIPFLRDFLIWYKFVGQSNSKDYLEGFSHRLELWLRAVLLLLYLGSIGIIFGVARHKVDVASQSYILKA